MTNCGRPATLWLDFEKYGDKRFVSWPHCEECAKSWLDDEGVTSRPLKRAVPVMTLSFEAYEEPKRWSTDEGRLRWSADGEVVVTCSEHGEVSRLLSTAHLSKEYPEYHGNSCLARDNHLWFEHGIAQGHQSRD